MYFDRKALNGGITVYSTIMNGKAQLELTAYLQADVREESSGEAASRRKGLMVEFRMTDREGRDVLKTCVLAEEVSRVRSLLIYPHLWQVQEDSYIYGVFATLLKGEAVLDEVETYHAFRTFSTHPTKGWMLNDKAFVVRGVRYDMPTTDMGGTEDKRRVLQDLQAIRELGANTVCMTWQPQDALLYELCDKMGLVIWKEFQEEKNQDIPELVEENGAGLLTLDRRRKRDMYYYYKACWNKEPFVHICGHEDAYRNGNRTDILVYSNQKKAALYVDGVLYEWKESAPSFLFEDVPLEKEETVISVQAGDYYSSMTLFST